MTTNARIRRVSSPAYYLARPAALWLAAFAPRPTGRAATGAVPARRIAVVHQRGAWPGCARRMR